jgi:hypothetical protein
MNFKIAPAPAYWTGRFMPEIRKNTEPGISQNQSLKYILAVL